MIRGRIYMYYQLQNMDHKYGLKNCKIWTKNQKTAKYGQKYGNMEAIFDSIFRYKHLFL